MPNAKAAIKDLRQSKKSNEYNLKIKNELKDLVKKVRKAIQAKDSKAKELMDKTFKKIDKAEQKGVLKKNTAARKKSRLHAEFNKTQK